jgi:transcriptional regulator with XRE-family HTH domain
MTLSQKIARWLASNGRSQRWLATAIGVSANAVSKIVAGGDTSYRTAFQIAQVFGVSVSWLLDDTSDWPPQERTGVIELSDFQLLHELHRRCDVIEGGVRKFMARLSDARLGRLERLASKKTPATTEQRELNQGLEDILLHELAGTRLDMLIDRMSSVTNEEYNSGVPLLDGRRATEHPHLLVAYLEFLKRTKRLSPAARGWAGTDLRELESIADIYRRSPLAGLDISSDPAPRGKTKDEKPRKKPSKSADSEGSA